MLSAVMVAANENGAGRLQPPDPGVNPGSHPESTMFDFIEPPPEANPVTASDPIPPVVVDDTDNRTDADFDAMAIEAAWREAVESGPVL
jgi:hypothetical protein